MRYDVIVVGAGPAGCAAAYDLSAAGRRVLVIDRRRFPRTKPCAGGLTMKTLRRLRYPVDAVVRQVCSDVVVGKRLETFRTLRGAREVCAMTVRAEFDDYCVQRTVERGAELRTIPHIAAITEDANEVVVETTGGALHASYLIGADGANGIVQRLVAPLGPVRRAFAIEAKVATSSPPPMAFDFGVVELGYGWLFPKRDHVNVGLYTSAPQLPQARERLAEYAKAKLRSSKLEELVGHHIGMMGSNAQLATGRVLLVGDAAGLVDPLLAEGIHNALASGQAAVAAIEAARRYGTELRVTYTRELRPILHDLRTVYPFAMEFYRRLDIGYRLLTSRLVSSVFMQSAARGLTFAATRRWFPLLALLSVWPFSRVPYFDAAAPPSISNSFKASSRLDQ